jgi:hypothetical protein
MALYILELNWIDMSDGIYTDSFVLSIQYSPSVR